MTLYRSRPRVIFTDLVTTFFTDNQDLSVAARTVKQLGCDDQLELSHSGAQIWQSAQATRLPIVVFHDLPKTRWKRALRALPCQPDLVIASGGCSAGEMMELWVRRVAKRLNLAADDILYVGDAEGSEAEAAASFGMRSCTGDEAVRQLDLLHFYKRQLLLSDRFGEEAELANIVLLPLDLNIYDMGDTDILRRWNHFVFDTVLIVEGVVATSGFSLKALEKNIGSGAVLLYGIADEDEPQDTGAIVQERLLHIRRSGGVKLILVHTNSAAEADDHNIAEIARGLGYCVELRTWKTLMSQFEREPAWDA